MRWLLCVALITGGCAGRSAKVYTPQNIKRGAPKLLVRIPVELRYNTSTTVKVLIAGNDSRFEYQAYVLKLSMTGESSDATFLVYPRRLRAYVITLSARERFLAFRGSVRITVSLHPFAGYNWRGALLYRPPILTYGQDVEMKGQEVD